MYFIQFHAVYVLISWTLEHFWEWYLTQLGKSPGVMAELGTSNLLIQAKYRHMCRDSRIFLLYSIYTLFYTILYTISVIASLMDDDNFQLKSQYILFDYRAVRFITEHNSAHNSSHFFRKRWYDHQQHYDSWCSLFFSMT